MSKYNLAFLKMGKQNRIIEINQDDIFTMFDWYTNFEKLDPLAKTRGEDQRTVVRLEKGPAIKQRCETPIMLSELDRIAMWYKYYPTKTEQDQEVYKIIDQALNPKEEKKS